MPNIIDRTLSVGLLHAASSELLIRTAMNMLEKNGFRFRYQSKQVFNRFFDDYRRLMRSYERVQEIATDKRINEDTAQLFDTLLNDSGTLVMLSMLYFNATNETNPNWEKNSRDIMNVLKNLTLADTNPVFSMRYIEYFAPEVEDN
ncbi:MAG: hypothetical protein ACI4TV_00470 [Paludibacteraceae bacterium]